MNQIQNKAILFFVKNTKYKQEDLVKIEQQSSSGFSFINYKITTKDKKQFIIKLIKSNIDLYCNEALIYKNYAKKEIIFSDEQGNLIKKWIDGQLFSLDKQYEARIDNLFSELKKIHNIKVNNHKLEIFDWSKYIDILASNRKYIDLYNKILLKYKDELIKVVHGDINNKNIILTKNNKVKLIDFEWACYNYSWFDPINYLCEENIEDGNIFIYFMKKMKITSFKVMYELMFLRWYYCYGWASKENHLDNIKQYMKLSKKKVKHFYKLIISNS